MIAKKEPKRSKKRSSETGKKLSKTKQDQANNERLPQIAFIMQTNYTYILAGASEILRQDTVSCSYQMQTFNIFGVRKRKTSYTKNRMAVDILNKSLEGTINLLFAITCLEMGLPVRNSCLASRCGQQRLQRWKFRARKKRARKKQPKTQLKEHHARGKKQKYCKH